jgi:DNA polymerase III subunit alpha
MLLEQLKPLKLEKEFAGVQLPTLQINSKYYKELRISEQSSNYEFLRNLCYKGYTNLIDKGKIDESKKEEYAARVKEELNAFKKLNFVDYVLIVWDVIRFCKESGIPTGIGRGSVCGSLVFYLIRVTNIDPLKYNLYFQRFISETRANSKVIDGELYLDGSLMADVDLDIDYLKRDEVVAYLNSKYPERISKIINLNTLTGKNLIKECGKVVGNKNEYEMNQISELIPQIFGEVQDIETVYRHNKEFKKWCDENKEVYKIALKLRNLIKHRSVHASGIIISHDKLQDICPLELSSQDELVSGFDMKDITKFCIKLDILGLKTITVIDEVCKLVGIKMEDIDFNDPIIYEFLQDFIYSYGIFQLEAPTAEKTVRLIKPKNLNELSDTMALARPGALRFIKQYIENRENPDSIDAFGMFKDIFESTNGIPIFQEQLMAMLHKLGFELGEAEQARKIVGKKLLKEVKEWENKIYKQCEKNKIDKKIADLTWGVLNDSASYSFNKSHSIAYSALAAITIYLKVKYPKEFFFASLKIAAIEADRNEKILRIANEMRSLGIKLLPPSLKYSTNSFTLEKNGIRYGLASMRYIKDKALENLRKLNIEQCNKFQLFESAKQAKINIGVLSALIQAGTMEDFQESRTKLVLEAQLWNILSEKERVYCLEHGAAHNFDLIEMVKSIMSWIGNNGKPIARQGSKQNRLDTINKHYQKYQTIYTLNTKNEKLANWFYERNILGYSYSMTLKEVFSEDCPQLTPINEFNNIDDKSSVIMVGIVNDIRNATSKNNKKYSKIKIDDGTGVLECFVFDNKGGEPGVRTVLKSKNKFPKINSICAFSGVKYQDIFIIKNCQMQDHKIAMKLSDIENIGDVT